MTKKIAICMSGHMRLYQKHIDSWKSLFQEYDCYLFIYTWDHMDFNYEVGQPCYHPPYPKGFDHTTKTDIETVKQSYLNIGAKYCQIEVEEYKSNEYWYEKYKDWCYGMEDVKNRICQWNLISKSCKLKSKYEENENIIFDYMIYSRPDVIFFKNDIDRYLFNDKIILCGKPDPYHLVSDICWYGPCSLMKNLCNIYDDFEFVWRETKEGDQLLANCHRMLNWYCEKKKIPYEIVPNNPTAKIVKQDKFIF